MIQSNINSDVNEDFLRFSKEGQKYDRKSAKIEVKDIANTVAGFANADGGLLAIGIKDDGTLEGFENYPNKDNDFLSKLSDFLKTVPEIKSEKLNITNINGNNDFILLLYIETSCNSLIRNVRDEVYLRRGDSTIKLNDEEIQILKVDRPELSYEDQLVLESSIDDIDVEMVNIYKEKIGASDKDYLDVLRARGFLKKAKTGGEYLTNAGVILFAKDPTIIFPCARIRVIKYEGTYPKTGENLNTIKDESFRMPLYKAILATQSFIRTQLRDFNHLTTDGIFEKVPEYPEFAWIEGLTNAGIHRNYAMHGEHIKIFIFDDRMEIRSPGKLAGLVTLENMKNVRYARNPKISETMAQLGLVKELNEGVSRIYEEMEKFFLDSPVYEITQGDILKLTLKNNYVMRDTRETETLRKNDKINVVWDKLTPLQRDVIQYISTKGNVSTSDLIEYTNRSKPTVLKILKEFEEKNLIEWVGTNEFDPQKKYRLK